MKSRCNELPFTDEYTLSYSGNRVSWFALPSDFNAASPELAALSDALQSAWTDGGVAAIVDAAGAVLPWPMRQALVAAMASAAGGRSSCELLRGDSEVAWQASLIGVLRRAEFPEAQARAADHPRCGLLRLVSERPETILWFDDVITWSAARELLPRLGRGRMLLTGLSRAELAQLPIAARVLELPSLSGANGWGAAGVDALSAGATTPMTQLLALWSCIDQELPDPDRLRAAWPRDAPPGEFECALDALTAQGCVYAAAAGGLRLDPQLHGRLPGALPAALRSAAVQTWTAANGTWGTAAEPERVVLIADALASRDAADIAVVRAARELCRRTGAWLRAVYWGLTVTRQNSAAAAEVQAADWLALAAAQRSGSQWLDARRSARHAEELLELDPAVAPELRLECKCEIAEIDLAEGRAERAFQRLEAVRTEVTQARVSRELVARWMYLHGACLLAGKQLARSEQVLRRGWELRQVLLPADDEALLSHRSLLARNLFAQQRWAEAEALLQDDLRIRRASPRVAPAETAAAANLLAELYFVQGRYVAAEPLFTEVLAVRQLTLAADDRLIGETAARLAGLKSSRGDYAGADPLYRLALNITETAFGSEHPRVAEILNDLARMLFTQSRYDQSRRLLERALVIQQQSLRRTDPRIAETRNNLAAVLVARGHYEHAAKLYEETLHGLQESGRLEHPTRATTLNNLGDVYRSLGRYDEAERQLQAGLDLRVKLLGAQHPTVAQSLSNLGYLRLLQGRFAAARADIEQALAIRRASIGDRHPHTANSLGTLGEIQRRLGATTAAAGAFEEAAEINRQTFGDRHQQYGASLAQLGRAEFALERRAKAELHLLKARMILEDTVGVNHRLMASVWLGLAELDRADGRHLEAFPLLERALAIQKQTLAADRYEAAETLLAIGCNLMARQAAASAVPRLAEADRLLASLPEPPADLQAEVLRCAARAALDTGSTATAEAFVGRALELVSASARRRRDLLMLQGELSLAQGRPAEAERAVRELLAAAESEGAGADELIPLLDQLSAALVLQRRPEEAEPIVRRSLSLTRTQHRRRHPAVAARLNQLGAILAQLDRAEPAREAFAEAAEMLAALGGTDHAPLEQSLRGQAEVLHRLQRGREALELEARADTLAGRASHVLDDIL